MSAYRVPNLRRDFAVSVVLVLMALAAVVPGVLALAIAVAGTVGLTVHYHRRSVPVTPVGR